MEQDRQVPAAVSPEAVAFHEAGHAVAGIAIRRRFSRLSIVPVDGEPKGCKWTGNAASECDLIICDLAGARAQVHFCPDSIPSEKLDIFRNQLLLPDDQHHHYSYTGWVEDLRPALSLLLKPHVPVLEFKGAVTIGVFVRAADENLKSFFARSSVSEAVLLTAETLLRSAIVKGRETEDLIVEIEKRLTSEDYVQVRPACARRTA